MEHARYRVINSEGYDSKWSCMSLGLRRDVQLHPSSFQFIIPSSRRIWKRGCHKVVTRTFVLDLVRGISMIFRSSVKIRRQQNQMGKESGANVEACQSPLVRG